MRDPPPVSSVTSAGPGRRSARASSPGRPADRTAATAGWPGICRAASTLREPEGDQLVRRAIRRERQRQHLVVDVRADGILGRLGDAAALSRLVQPIGSESSPSGSAPRPASQLSGSRRRARREYRGSGGPSSWPSSARSGRTARRSGRRCPASADLGPGRLDQVVHEGVIDEERAVLLVPPDLVSARCRHGAPRRQPGARRRPAASPAIARATTAASSAPLSMRPTSPSSGWLARGRPARPARSSHDPPAARRRQPSPARGQRVRRPGTPPQEVSAGCALAGLEISLGASAR